MKRHLLYLSLGFVAAFVAGYIGGSGHQAVPSETATPDAGSPREIREPQPTPVAASAVVIPFKWSLIESTNRDQYISNLRSIQCPEQMITEILRADLTRSFGPRYAELAASRSQRRARGSEPVVMERARKRRELQREIDTILYEQLGLEPPMRVTRSLFTAEQEERIAEAHKLFPLVRTHQTNSDFADKPGSNRVARVEYLSRFLPQEQMQCYKLDREGDTNRVQAVLQGMQPTKREFLRTVDALEAEGAKSNPDLTNAMRSVLPPERFALWQELRQPEYQALLRYGPLRSLSPAALGALVALRREVFPANPAAYREKVRTILQQPMIADHYLNDMRIHPRANP